LNNHRPPALPHPLLSLAEANALLFHGCTQTYLSPQLSKGGQPLPWLLAQGETTIIAEPWSHHHRIHRKKRGFSLMCRRWQALLSAVHAHLAPATLELQIWQDSDDLDPALIEKVSKQIEISIAVFDTARIASISEALLSATLETDNHRRNPLLSTLAHLKQWVCLTEQQTR